ncbi:hypothetical protein MJO28_009741 [Puccinia striiformis f. sp. tritici]|uniref:Uncharacterized protein n=1 Tax=Puccinia striiformis f. sp. tritici TaxID=168172 RepID=A0ACC0E8T0_9BASI|nr:hypothetical protein MJO28_009741 [Puccinia striiformis f. sp. tritici]
MGWNDGIVNEMIVVTTNKASISVKLSPQSSRRVTCKQSDDSFEDLALQTNHESSNYQHQAALLDHNSCEEVGCPHAPVGTLDSQIAKI